MPIPVRISRSTPGIFEYLAVISKKYARRIMMQKAISM
jgi:hypothetical protein